MPAAPTTRQLVVCSLGEEEYALPIEQVREIVQATAPRPVVSDVPWMRGVISLRGRLVPVYDLAARLGVSVAPAAVAQGGETVPPTASARAKIVIVETESELAGIVVDDVVEVLTVDVAEIEGVPGLAPATAPGGDSIVRRGDRLVLLIDPTALLALGDEDGERAAA